MLWLVWWLWQAWRGWCSTGGVNIPGWSVWYSNCCARHNSGGWSTLPHTATCTTDPHRYPPPLTVSYHLAPIYHTSTTSTSDPMCLVKRKWREYQGNKSVFIPNLVSEVCHTGWARSVPYPACPDWQRPPCRVGLSHTWTVLPHLSRDCQCIIVFAPLWKCTYTRCSWEI